MWDRERRKNFQIWHPLPVVVSQGQAICEAIFQESGNGTWMQTPRTKTGRGLCKARYRQL